LKHFVTRISAEGVIFTSLSDDNALVEEHYDFTDRNEHRYKEQLNAFLGSSQLKDRDHDEHTISWFGSRTTLIPSSVFNESDATEIFRLCFGGDTNKSDIDYNRLPDLGIVNVFELPLWLKSFFVMRYPRSVIQHEGSVILRSFMHHTPFRLKILVSVYRQHFQLLIADQGKLIFYSTFDHGNTDDILYNLMFTLQQKELLDRSGNLILTSGVGSDINADELTEKIQRIQNLGELKITVDQTYTLKAHQLCV
jgi:hypothetical protein